MIIGRDIVIVSMQSWDVEIGSNCKNIAAELAKDNRVLYVNYPLDRITVLRDRKDPKVKKRLSILAKKQKDIEHIGPNLWNLYPRTILESITWLPPGTLYQKLNYLNNSRFSKRIKEAADYLEFKDIIIFNDNLIERGLYLKELLKPASYIYYLRDNLNYNPYHRKHGEKAEKELISKVDVVVANSDFLADYARKYNGHSYMVGQGCEIDLFRDEDDSIPIAEEIASIPSPIIGYIGALTSLRLDIALMIGIAASLPEMNLVLVGPEDEAFEKSALHELENVYFLNKRPPEQLPNFLKGFDVALNPQLVNDLTIGNYPRKIDEYLAMGKPTVSTKTPFMDYFKGDVYLAATLSEYVQMIKKALAENTPERIASRKNTASLHTWAKSVEAIGESYLKSIKNK
ncbi:glycosyl transferase family 1 [Anditalea andensis]|uniref:Glycosyl transferase family 1 n=2 Tax=Anditalea andensis TaxID=1048983 RepID=A0A074L1Y0_9BACT|nr:glycosyl transferase family 1 [Anditalea andensis]